MPEITTLLNAAQGRVYLDVPHSRLTPTPALTLTPTPNRNQDVVVGHQTLPTLYLDELRALALHYGVDPDDTSAPTPTTDQPAAAVAVAVAVAASAPGGKLGSRGSGLAMV